MFRVMNFEDEGEDLPGGLTLEQAAKKRLDLAGYRYEFRQVGEFLTLFLSERRATIHAPAGRLTAVKTATFKDPRTAELELCQWIVDAPLGGPYIVVTDYEYAREKGRAASADEQDEDFPDEGVRVRMN